MIKNYVWRSPVEESVGDEELEERQARALEDWYASAEAAGVERHAEPKVRVIKLAFPDPDFVNVDRLIVVEALVGIDEDPNAVSPIPAVHR